MSPDTPASQPELELIVYDGSQEVSRVLWNGRRMVIGRRSNADIHITDPTLSATHAEIVPVDGRPHLRDLRSLNGTEVNGVRISEAPLRAGDWIKLGEATMRVGERSPDTDSGALFVDPKPSSETMRVSLDLLHQKRHQTLAEDRSMRLLSDLFEALKSADDRRQIFAEVRHSLSQAYPRARIYLLEGNMESGWHDPEANEPEDERPSQTVTLEAARSNNAVLSTYLPQDERFAGAESVRISGIKSVIAAPASCDGEPVVLLYAHRLGLPGFSKSDLQLLGIAANHLTAVLENASRISALRSTNRELLEARERLARLNDELEDRVRERTAEIQRQAEEIAALAEAKDELLGIAAHDIRGPLTVIQGNAELLRLRLGQLEEEVLDRSLGVIHDAARGLSQLLSELLDAQAMESGKIKLHKRPYAVEKLLREATGVGRLAAEDMDIKMEISVDSELEAEIDPRRLGQAISNLVLNAIKFSKPGTCIQLVGRTAENGRCRISVADQGIGIPEAEIDRVFESFEQGIAGRKKRGGSGLGLMIAKSVVELHGGELRVESEVGIGTRFTIDIP